jgi:hypothetical protein
MNRIKRLLLPGLPILLLSVVQGVGPLRSAEVGDVRSETIAPPQDAAIERTNQLIDMLRTGTGMGEGGPGPQLIGRCIMDL